jgi:hypothetical protein
MEKVYDHIIWGASIKGVFRAAELSRQGKSVILLNKFGFPGGKVTESLASLFQKNETVLNENMLSAIRKKRFGVLFEDRQWLLLHPEAVKRSLLETLDNMQAEYLFHVIPISVDENDFIELKLFGRQGHFSVFGKEIHDLSDDRQLNFPSGKKVLKTDLLIHCFITGALPVILPGFNILRRFETPIGLFCSFSLKNIPFGKADQAFNAELDRLARYIWKDHGARLLMLPVQPEIIFEKE